MTTNKPEVVGYLPEFSSLSEDGTFIPSPEHFTTYAYAYRTFGDECRMVPVIRLSDYEALQAECEKLREFVERAKTLLEDPFAVFVNMKAGVIAKPSLRDLIDLHGDVPNGEDVQLLEIARHRAESESLRKLVAECADYLNHNEHTCIHNGSALHRKLIEAAEKEDSQ